MARARRTKTEPTTEGKDVAVEKVAMYHKVPGTRTWVESVHETIEDARKEATRLIDAGEAELVRFEHRLYPGKAKKVAKPETAPKVEESPVPAPEAEGQGATTGSEGAAPKA